MEPTTAQLKTLYRVCLQASNLLQDINMTRLDERTSTARRSSKVTHSKVKSIIYQGFCVFEMVALFPPRCTRCIYMIVKETIEIEIDLDGGLTYDGIKF